MIKYYRTMDHQIHEISEPMEGTWISLIHPTAAELAKIATDYKIDIDDLRAPLDEEERSHIEVEEGYTLFIVDVPTTEERDVYKRQHVERSQEPLQSSVL